MKNLSQVFCSLKNAQQARKRKLSLPFSKFTWAVIRVLLMCGCVEGSIIWENRIHVFLKSGSNRSLRRIQQISRPKRRIYISHRDLLTVGKVLGLVIISTSKGVYTGQQAQKHRLGGEVLCRVL